MKFWISMLLSADHSIFQSCDVQKGVWKFKIWLYIQLWRWLPDTSYMIPCGHPFINSLFYCHVAYENIPSYYFTSQLFQSSSQPHAEPRGPLHRICSIKSCFLKYISFSLQLSVTGLLVLCFVRRGNRIGYLVSSICEFLSRFLGWNRDPRPTGYLILKCEK